jgi:hypothetical protein
MMIHGAAPDLILIKLLGKAMVRGYERTSMLLLARKIKIVGRELHLQVSLKRR